MIKFLPILRKILFILIAFFVIGLSLFSFTAIAKAQSAPTPTGVPEGSWVKDQEVTFVGKTAARSGEFLDWTLKNYDWSSVSPGTSNPLATFWATIRNIVYAFFILFVLVTAFVIIVTRGRNITVAKFIPKLIIIILLVTFSFALVQFIYQVTDAIQGFFLKSPSPDCTSICQKDLFYWGWNYQDFEGFRFIDQAGTYDESAFIALLLVRLTALTYYVMVGILILRKIILWFFIIISPIFPLLLLYSPIRNTAKIWVGEFFRWLLYAPIFAIFLSGLVVIWRSQTNIPLQFNLTNTKVIYPTAINILLGGPGQVLSYVSPAQSNSVNNIDTFALYVVALLMLWVVIILPFLLLQIFLDYLNNFSFGESAILKQLIAGGSAFVNRAGPGLTPPPPTIPAGIARALPFIPGKVEIPEIRATEAIINAQVADMRGIQASSDILRLASLSVPTMRDIAKYETALLSSDIGKHQDIARFHETLEGIANPKRVATPAERQNYNLMQGRLKREAQRGDPLASSILSAASIVSKSSLQNKQEENARVGSILSRMNNLASIISTEEKERLNAIKSSLIEAAQKGDPLANSILSAMKEGKTEIDEKLKEQLLEAKERGSALAASILEQAGVSVTVQTFPVTNRVQAVSIDDYEAVKKVWQENYQKLEPPRTIEGKQKNREEWIIGDIDRITETINLLTSEDVQNIKKGMEEVSAILPFLLIGGFAQTEVIAYLKAKLEAAKSVSEEISKKEEEEETMLGREKAKTDKPAEMEMKEEVKENQNN